MDVCQTWDELRALGLTYPRWPAPPHCRQMRPALTIALARVAAHEGKPALAEYRRRAWLNPHLRAALPAEKREVAA